MPDLGLGDRPVALSGWLVKKGARVTAGEPVVEVAADGVAVDLSSPIDGVLVRKFAADGDVLTVGQRLAVVEADS